MTTWKDEFFKKDATVVAGWGVSHEVANPNDSDVLMKTNLTVLSVAYCRTVMKINLVENFCAKNNSTGACYGDSGGKICDNNYETIYRMVKKLQ